MTHCYRVRSELYE